MVRRYTKLDRFVMGHIQDYGFITIKQSGRIFYKGKSTGGEVARRQLNKLCEMNELERYKDMVFNEYIYVTKNTNKTISFHKIVSMNLYSEIYEFADNIDYFKLDEYWKIDSNKKRFSDCHIVFTMNKGTDKEYKKAFFIEIDKYHKTDGNKYEEIYNSKIVHKWYEENMGAEYFPDILIIDSIGDKAKINNGKYSIIYIDFNFDNLLQKVII